MQLLYLAVVTLTAPVFAQPVLYRSAPGTLTVKSYIPDYNISDVCFPGQAEECQGSFSYCFFSGWKAKGEPKQYKNRTECLLERFTGDSPNPSPGGKIPYLEGTNVDCGHNSSPAFTEMCTGTSVFCQSAKEGEKACLDARTPPPRHLPFRKPADCKRNTEMCLGTTTWCLKVSDGQQACMDRREQEF